MAELKAERKAAKKLRRTLTAEQVAAASVIQRAFRVAIKTWRLRLRRRLKAEARAERQLVHRVVQVQSACEQCTRIVVAGFCKVAMLHWVTQAMQFVLAQGRWKWVFRGEWELVYTRWEEPLRVTHSTWSRVERNVRKKTGCHA